MAADNWTEQCIDSIGDMAFKDIFLDKRVANFMAIGIPVISSLGIIGNLIVFWLNNHKFQSGFSILVQNTLLLVDCMLLVSAILLYVPRGHLATWYTVQDCGEKSTKFWATLDYSQQMYTIAHPMWDTSQCLVIWYTLTYVIDQYAVFYHPFKICAISKSQTTSLKILVVIFNMIIISSLVHFFKFVRKDALYHNIDHKNICLSEIYGKPSYRNYDIYFYFGILNMLPLFFVLIALLRICIETYTLKQESSPEIRGVITQMREGRSRRTVIAVSIVFLICYGVANSLKSLLIAKPLTTSEVIGCYLVPMDTKFAYAANGLVFELSTVICLIIYSASKFPLCYIAGKRFRELIHVLAVRSIKRMASCCSLCRRKEVSRYDKLPPDLRRQILLRNAMEVYYQSEANRKSQVCADVPYHNAMVHSLRNHSNRTGIDLPGASPPTTYSQPQGNHQANVRATGSFRVKPPPLINGTVKLIPKTLNYLEALPKELPTSPLLAKPLVQDPVLHANKYQNMPCKPKTAADSVTEHNVPSNHKTYHTIVRPYAFNTPQGVWESHV